MQEGQSGNLITPGENKSDTSWQFHSQEPTEQASQPEQIPTPEESASGSEVNWTASEFIAHNKSSGWYGALTICTIGFGAIVYLFTHGDKVSTAVVGIVAVVFGISASRKPRELQYVVNDNGIRIGNKLYPYAGLRSFSIVKEEGIESIWFIPLKRFNPILSIYFSPNDGQKIVDVLSKFLPLEHRQLDVVDKLMHRLRF